MTISARSVNRATGLLVLLAVVGLSGCSDGTSLNGKIFDLLGVSDASQANARAEPAVAARPGLVLPPDTQRLPAPGSGDDVQTPTLAAIVDPDVKRANDVAERQRLHRAYCSGQINWKERLADPNASPTSPYGPCGLLSEYVKSK